MISKRCKYAVKALIHIAKHQIEDKGVFSSTISEEEHIPKKFLEGILRDLRNAQILKSKRGAQGGYILNQQPKDIILTDLIRLMDGPIAMMPCVSLKYYEKCDTCKEESTCSIRDVFFRLREQTLALYNQTTLETMVAYENQFK